MSDSLFLIIGQLTTQKNIDPRGPFLTLLIETNFNPRGEVIPRDKLFPLGVKLSPRGEIFCSPPILLNSGECSPHGGEQRGEHSPRERISPLEANLTPGVKFWMALRLLSEKCPLTPTWGRCYDHNFLRFLPTFSEKIGAFLKKQCYEQNFA
jgi:hypothetical protein